MPGHCYFHCYVLLPLLKAPPPRNAQSSTSPPPFRSSGLQPCSSAAQHFNPALPPHGLFKNPQDNQTSPNLCAKVVAIATPVGRVKTLNYIIPALSKSMSRYRNSETFSYPQAKMARFIRAFAIWTIYLLYFNGFASGTTASAAFSALDSLTALPKIASSAFSALYGFT